jgi:hypothetical protein
VDQFSATDVALPLLAALLLAAVHLGAGRLGFLWTQPRSQWLSFAGGIAVAYVFVRIMPELAASQDTIAELVRAWLGFIEHHVFLIALTGLVVFYGLERTAVRSRRRRTAAGEDDRTSAAVFWLHIASFTLYNALVGYLLVHREVPTALGLVFLTVAMAVHFVVNDFGLREHHKDLYTRYGRWLLAAAVLAGWLVGVLTRISDAAVAVLLAFLGGGVILNVLKEELPDERASRFWPFALGVAIYAALLLLL